MDGQICTIHVVHHDRGTDQLIDFGDQEHYLVASWSKPGTWHEVNRVRGPFTCFCQGYHNLRPCRHVQAVIAHRAPKGQAALAMCGLDE